MKLKKIENASTIPGVECFEIEYFRDQRGYFAELYNLRNYSKFGIDENFVQDNHSLSKLPGTLRGLHFQKPPCAQAKLVRCGRGKIFDVVVDIRLGSPTFKKWEGFLLSPENGRQLYIPKGLAHGFVTLEPNSEIIYKCSDYYAPEGEVSISWQDPSFSIEWPVDGHPILSQKDANAQIFDNVKTPFIFGEIE